jgi:hypothetical protein
MKYTDRLTLSNNHWLLDWLVFSAKINQSIVFNIANMTYLIFKNAAHEQFDYWYFFCVARDQAYQRWNLQIFITIILFFSIFFLQLHIYILFIWEKATSEGWNVIYGKLSYNTGANDTFNALELPKYVVVVTRQEWSL